MFHSTGDGTWTAQTTGVVQAIYGIWGSGPKDVYLVDLHRLHLPQPR